MQWSISEAFFIFNESFVIYHNIKCRKMNWWTQIRNTWFPYLKKSKFQVHSISDKQIRLQKEVIHLKLT